ncbi:hypothetical protein VIGAN_07191000 [Vigna angularis var. angularis]|uniref:Uncharacterized protein n=1 Tax=Vigna angularis var. angularis TaxID=157739 RepID=A0A0S3SJQ6_PHAAN|nr:hypothetical protein VIGAN_07191000 [Vigna angularis var. angularis]
MCDFSQKLCLQKRSKVSLFLTFSYLENFYSNLLLLVYAMVNFTVSTVRKPVPDEEIRKINVPFFCNSRGSISCIGVVKAFCQWP